MFYESCFVDLLVIGFLFKGLILLKYTSIFSHNHFSLFYLRFVSGLWFILLSFMVVDAGWPQTKPSCSCRSCIRRLRIGLRVLLLIEWRKPFVMLKTNNLQLADCFLLLAPEISSTELIGFSGFSGLSSTNLCRQSRY